MKGKFTKGQLLDLLSNKLAHQMSKMALEQIKEGLELRLEALDTDDLFDARAAAQHDIEREFGADEFPEFGSMENPKTFVHSIDNAPQKGADVHASAWQEHYGDFNDKVTRYITNDPKLAEYSKQNPHEFLNAMATAMYKYMMDHNSSSPFISSIQQWIIDLDDQFDPTNEETGEVEMDPASWRMYKLFGNFEKEYNRSVLKKKVAHAAAVPLKEQKELLESALLALEDFDDMDLDGGSLSDDPASVNSAFRVDDVSHGFYVMPPTATDPRWYVVNSDGEPVADYDTEPEANAAIPGLEAQSVTPEPQIDDLSTPQFGRDFKESRLARMEALLNEADALLQEYGSNIPMGANTMDAPWNATETMPAKKKPKSVFALVDKDDECLIVHHGGEYYAMPLQGMMPDTAREIAIDFVGVPELGPGLHDASEYSASNLPAEALVDYLNDNVGHLNMGAGIEAWEGGMNDLVKVDHALARVLKAEYPRLSVPLA